MLVTQSDYTLWQNMYGQANKGAKETDAASNQTNNQLAKGQEFAIQTGKDQDVRSTLAGTVREKSFLEVAFERILNNRLGIDQGKMDELKEEIKNTETAIEALSKEKPHTEKQQQELVALEDKLKQLEEALNELVKQAAQRAIENEKPAQDKSKLIAQYQSVASLVKKETV